MDVLSRLTSATVCVVLFVCLNACENATPISEFGSKPDGSNSPVGMSILVPIELTDNGMWSNTTQTIFNRTRTSLDTSYYDGDVTYSFEIVAVNTDTVNKIVTLIDSFGTTRASINIPPSTSVFTYLSVLFTPNSGSDNYRVVLPATSFVDKVKVLTARIVVRQIGATKTRVYVPMYAFDPDSAFRLDGTANITADTIYNGASPPPLRTFPLWQYKASNLSNLAAGTPYTVEAIMSNTTGTGTAYLALFKNAATIIPTSEVSTPSFATEPTLITRQFSASEIADTDIIEASIKSSASNSARIHKAGLWIALENISKVEVYYRIGRSSNSNTTGYWPEYRVRPDVSGLSNPSGFFEICGHMGTGSQMGLFDVGVSDNAITDLSPSLLTSLGLPSSRGISRSASLPLSGLVGGTPSHFITKFNYTSGGTAISGAYFIIQFDKNPP